MDSTNFDFVGKKDGGASVKLIAGAVTGGLATLCLVALLVGLVVLAKRGKKNYEKIPLLHDE